MNPESNIHYIKPEESDLDEELRHHRFELLKDGKVVSVAEVNYYSRPMPFYQISSLYTEFESQGNGFASEVMDQVEKFLIERRKPGLLEDSSTFNKADGRSFYESRGWVEIDKEGHRVFNLPADINPEIFAGYYMRGEDVSQT